ncbi:MAG: SDR family oxidoreductase, partial [Actinomycetota bacterium]
MRIGILGGTGPAGSALGARLASVGYDVVIGSRSRYRAMEAVDGLRSAWPDLNLSVTAGDNVEAASCDVVVLATPWDSAATTAQDNIEHLRGKVVISMANALVRVGGEIQPLLPPRGSVAAHVQAAVPECRVVAAFHHLPAKELGPRGIRCNLVAAGPIRTMAAKSIPGFKKFEDVWDDRAPLGWDVNDSSPVARTTVA